MSEKNENLKQMPYRKKRYIAYIIASIVSLSLPFIQINGNQIFLLSFDKKQLHLLGTAFDMQELYLMPFLLMLLFIGIFAVTAIGGRAWCGWACPQTIFRVIYRDLIESTLLKLRRIKNKQKDIDLSKNSNRVKKAVGVVLWSILALVAASNFMWYFVPPQDFFAYIQNPLEHMFLIGFVLAIAGFLIYDVIILKEDFCVYICPYSRVQSVLYDNNTLHAIYSNQRGGAIYNDKKEKTIFNIKDFKDPNSECTACEACVTVCPTHIDIRKGLQLECINCLECVDACTTVMGKLGKPSLVQWSSTNTIVENKPTKVFRKTTIMYMVALTLVLVLLFAMSREKEYMLLNVNKDTELYKIKEDNIVANNYTLLFQNTESVPLTYNIEIVDNPGIEIKRFTPFTLSPKKMAKKVLILETDKLLVDDKTKDTPISITIKAYAQENPEKVVVFRKATFFFPRSDKLK
ncbi:MULTISPECIES: cytochrome c oxidase accessory protein CcoG [Aliarcobacter]|jgi:cytochrome c oxidase accessory protein FixG|uniref:Cytochrome c oxidase accessory protein CcoG n=4 Tax=Aliarcobacter skirrowii TaxID=28200 RepID=A0A2U2C3G5_9BACT|nr:cytochrome c oxidase accessory protein CcoG [Aliarcobacter skirrowii]AXX83974.1 cytochrome c oxidase accessory protein [Aliarcobacter skirrowii CCUG 10374]KAB0621835.1 cytochrome c oxidase accessory protein CcoG [Aliarcobacter skirrowii CCUG 10374]MCT7446432.1 cytochrome c oxidase accessory protein CcoG [Aliarcobacter skirrowii]MDX3959166.1 cytochrome c oxidase accessory protein CcoG [Aliarcobacter skirrowii]MDX4025938.1 cytochrome c oxidase accessory protein CcoG [Aliarcobacter skirrowii]